MNAVEPRLERSNRPGRRTTRPLVRVVDRLARFLITLAGLATIAAVSLVFVFLAAVVVPLFLPSSVREAPPVGGGTSDGDLLHLAADEYQALAWSYSSEGDLKVVNLEDGEILDSRKLFEEGPPLSASFPVRRGDVAFGFKGGLIRTGRIDFTTSFIQEGAVPEALRNLAPGARSRHEGGLVERTPEGPLRLQRLVVELEEPVGLGVSEDISLIDLSIRPSGPVVCALTSSGRLLIKQVFRTRNLLTGKVATTFEGGELSLDPRPGHGLPRHLLLSGVADSVLVVWEDGHAVRIDTREVASPRIAETTDLLPEEGSRLTALKFMIGKTSLLGGDSRGRVHVWFRIKPDRAATGDGSVLVPARTFEGEGPAVTAVSASARGRMAAAGFADGSVRIYHVTSDRKLAEAGGDGAGPVRALALAPKDDGVLAATARGLRRWTLRAPHPETTLASIFAPVWYEGYPDLAHVWQSSSGEDAFEPKLGLWPLVFGTLKATFYSMIFGVPLAILAAIYTSEFLHPNTKARIKPAIELMASLPSVVLGFLAALVFAPFIEKVVPQALMALVAVPVTFLAAGYAWQLIPLSISLRFARHRFLLLLAMLPAGIAVGCGLGPLVERAFFAGDIMGWVDGQKGSGVGAWMFLLLPLSGLGMAGLIARFVHPRLTAAEVAWSRTRIAWTDFLKFLAGLVGTFLLALALSWILNAAGWDPRGTFVDTYVQRNALVVGFVMGFAIIPIIYTVSEDALTAVPDHLRAASLGAGATRWQTAVRIIVPTAMSGLFSAVMIGFGRAVGETMIVLMAAGNTPVLEINLFNGFRTLAANIAVELPESVQGGTNFRMLFLAALTLFVMTFLVNTFAEAVRLRFRRRAYEL
jgi:phosphate transport system permease protein